MLSAEPSAVEARALTKLYGPVVAICDVSFAVPVGQIVALLGPNGAGKSTTMKILTGYLAATDGSASVAGFDVPTERLEAARRVGYLPENGPLYPDMTPRQLVRFFGEARGLVGHQLQERLDVVVELCDIGDILDKTIGTLSKGLRQRVGLAHALLHDPDVLVMDEPTAGLDPNQIRQFRALVQSLRGRKTLLLSTHILQEVEAVADRVLLISRGRLVFDGTPDAMRGAEGSLETPFHRLTRA